MICYICGYSHGFMLQISLNFNSAAVLSVKISPQSFSQRSSLFISYSAPRNVAAEKPSGIISAAQAGISGVVSKKSFSPEGLPDTLKITLQEGVGINTSPIRSSTNRHKSNPATDADGAETATDTPYSFKRNSCFFVYLSGRQVIIRSLPVFAASLSINPAHKPWTSTTTAELGVCQHSSSFKAELKSSTRIKSDEVNAFILPISVSDTIFTREVPYILINFFCRKLYRFLGLQLIFIRSNPSLR
ncbi:MAG: hypothetical protein IJO96_06045 [Oscillospiraceae bacterium]|nr:hypothetical protein [Oscillospiraceae bacterium]